MQRVSDAELVEQCGWSARSDRAEQVGTAFQRIRADA